MSLSPQILLLGLVSVNFRRLFKIYWIPISFVFYRSFSYSFRFHSFVFKSEIGQFRKHTYDLNFNGGQYLKIFIGVCDPPPAELPKDGEETVAEETQSKDFGVPDLPTVVKRPKMVTIRGRDLWARTKSTTFDGIYILMYPNNDRDKRLSLGRLGGGGGSMKEERKR